MYELLATRAIEGCWLITLQLRNLNTTLEIWMDESIPEPPSATDESVSKQYCLFPRSLTYIGNRYLTRIKQSLTEMDATTPVGEVFVKVTASWELQCVFNA